MDSKINKRKIDLDKDKINKLLVSIIIPIYNAEKYLERCLESICNQSYENLEIILINDGSIDNSYAICKRISQYDKRVKVLSQINKGVASARNLGLNVASGDFIYFIDADDYIELNTIEECLNMLIIEEADIICFNREEFFIKSKKRTAVVDYDKNLNTIDIIAGIYKRIYSCNVIDKIFKKSLWENIRFPEIRTAEDMYVLFAILEKSKKIVATDAVYYHYQRENECSATGQRMLDVYFNNFYAYYKGVIVAKNRKWNELYEYAIIQSFYYAIKAYQHGLYIDYLINPKNNILINEFFETYKNYMSKLPLEKQVYLLDYFYCKKILNRIKGFIYYFKWRLKNNGGNNHEKNINN